MRFVERKKKEEMQFEVIEKFVVSELTEGKIHPFLFCVTCAMSSNTVESE